MWTFCFKNKQKLFSFNYFLDRNFQSGLEKADESRFLWVLLILICHFKKSNFDLYLFKICLLLTCMYLFLMCICFWSVYTFDLYLLLTCICFWPVYAFKPSLIFINFFNLFLSAFIRSITCFNHTGFKKQLIKLPSTPKKISQTKTTLKPQSTSLALRSNLFRHIKHLMCWLYTGTLSKQKDHNSTHNRKLFFTPPRLQCLF